MSSFDVGHLRRWALPGDDEDPGELDRLSWWAILGPALLVGLVDLAVEIASDIVGGDWSGGHLRRSVAVAAGVGFGWLLWQRTAEAFRRAHLRAAARKSELAALSAVTEERGRLSRELHDGAAQVLAFILVQVDTILELLATGRIREGERQLEQLRTSTDRAYRETRDAVVDLRTDPARRGIASALRSLCEQVTSRTDITVNLYVTPIADRMAPTVQLQAFQIAREALANVQAHSGARNVWVRLDAHGPNTVLLSIRDDGVGFDPAVAHAGKKRFGLLTMRERAESVGGRLGITGQRGKGTSVVAELPLEPKGDEDHATDSAAAS